MKLFIKVLAFCIIFTQAVLALDCTATYGKGSTKLTLATGSPGELGLVEVLVNTFAKDHDVSVCWVKAGSGKSLSLLKQKEVDVIMVHAPEAEKAAVAEGWASDRTLLGSNEFYITGPKNDPAGIKSAKTAAQAYKKIAEAKALFYTRADNSGTHKKELSIWKSAGVKPAGDWYVANKDFMLATLKKADKTDGYFMTDSSTWVVAKNELSALEILFRGDIVLINTYNALKQPGLETPKKKLSKAFIDFLASEDGQSVIRTFGVKEYGEALYNDAKYAKQYDR
jgi:tungstate transport system substrate-binding protein